MSLSFTSFHTVGPKDHISTVQEALEPLYTELEQEKECSMHGQGGTSLHPSAPLADHRPRCQEEHEEGEAGVTDDRLNDGEALREEVIALRDEALRQDDFEWAVKLSHVVAWMPEAMQEVKEQTHER